MKREFAHPVVTAATLIGLCLLAVPVEGRTLLRDICRVKGQEESTLHGLGIVVGLKGTGDGGNFAPTFRALAQVMTLMGKAATVPDVKDAKNVALVTVTATIPAAGARQGDRIDCQVHSIGSAKSLAHGYLFLTPLLGPDPNSLRVYAFASGAISLDDEEITSTGRVNGGCRMEENFQHVFVRDGKITLVIDRNHADFQVAQDVAEAVNSQLTFGGSGLPLAKAVDQVNIDVAIPAQYRDDPVMFVSLVRGLPILEPNPGARVVINERAGTVTFSGEVEIGPAVITHKNIVIQTGNAVGGGRFVPIDVEQTNAPKLKALVDALDAVQVPPPDVIDIIKGLHRNGQLHAQLIID